MSNRDVEGARARLRAGIDEARGRLRSTNAVDVMALEMMADVDAVLNEVERLEAKLEALGEWSGRWQLARAQVRAALAAGKEVPG